MIYGKGGGAKQWGSIPKAHIKLQYTQINSRGILDINVKDRTIKLLENKVGTHLYDLRIGKDFPNSTQKRNSKPKEKTDTFDYFNF